MSTQYRPLIVGLVSPGLFWLAASVAQGQGTPSTRGPSTVPAPASSSTYAALLMSNGTVVQGEITDDPAGGVYRLKTRGGQVPYPKSSVKRAGRSLLDLYRYQVAALPPGDPDERMKLIRWCLTEHLTDQAREQLGEYLKSNPESHEAAAMATNLDAMAENRDRDAALQRTSGEMPQADAPASLDPAIVKRVRKGFGNNLPEILDLPPAQAVRRASEFAEHVQPVLQQHCAGCHNEKYAGDFQLVQVRNNAKDRRNPDIARANLDAVLRLVNGDDPARSEILSAGLVPHGPKKAPIFRGANDRDYQVISYWVKSLRPKNAVAGRGNGIGGEGVTQTGFAPTEAGDGFGVDKVARGSSSPSTGMADDKAAAYTPPGARRVVNEINESADFSGGAATNFPVPFSIGGKEFDKPTSTPAGRRAPVAPATLPALPGTKPAPRKPAQPEEEATGPAVEPTTAKQVGPNAVAVDIDGSMNELPGMNQPKYPTLGKPKAEAKPAPTADDDDEPAATPAPAPAKKTPKKVDPALLDKLIKSRNAGTP